MGDPSNAHQPTQPAEALGAWGLQFDMLPVRRLVEAGGKSIKDDLPGSLYYGINDESLVIANWNGVRAKVRVVLPMGDVDRILQQLFDALVD